MEESYLKILIENADDANRKELLQRILELVEDGRKYNVLLEYGVDNWSGSGEALNAMEEDF